MAKLLVSDELWTLLQPLLPLPPLHLQGGRRRLPDRAALTGILFVLKMDIPWKLLPAELGCGSGMTCWRRLQEWQATGVWPRLQQILMTKLVEAGQMNWSRVARDGAGEDLARSNSKEKKDVPDEI